MQLYSMLAGLTQANYTYEGFYDQISRLPSAGLNLNPYRVAAGNLQFMPSVSFSLNNSSSEFSYWLVGKWNTSTLNGLQFITISEKYSPMTFNFSVLTFYISVVYMAGKVLRLVTGGGSSNIVMRDMPVPDKLMDLCEGVYIARMACRLEQEQEYYYDLIDILRSPEMVKLITGRSSIKAD